MSSCVLQFPLVSSRLIDRNPRELLGAWVEMRSSTEDLCLLLSCTLGALNPGSYSVSSPTKHSCTTPYQANTAHLYLSSKMKKWRYSEFLGLEQHPTDCLWLDTPPLHRGYQRKPQSHRRELDFPSGLLSQPVLAALTKITLTGGLHRSPFLLTALGSGSPRSRCGRRGVWCEPWAWSGDGRPLAVSSPGRRGGVSSTRRPLCS